MKTLIVRAANFPSVLKLTQHLYKLSKECSVFLDISDFEITKEELAGLARRFSKSNFTLTWGEGQIQTPLVSFR